LRIWNYGPAQFDQTHVLVINYTYDLPRASKLWDNKVVRAVFDNWQLSGVTAFASGVPASITANGLITGGRFTTTTGADITGGGDDARLVIVGNPTLSSGDRKTVTQSNGLIGTIQWLNPPPSRSRPKALSVTRQGRDSPARH
jgi:hypothetical protein